MFLLLFVTFFFFVFCVSHCLLLLFYLAFFSKLYISFFSYIMLDLLLPTIRNTCEKQNVYMNYGYKFETVLEIMTSNSEIHLVKSLNTNEIFISKVYDLYGINENDLNSYMNELHIMKKLENCENIVKIVDFIKKNDSLSFIIEFCNQGDLYSDILRRKTNNEYYSENEIFNILNQILNGLSFIHKNGIIHGDLKSTNIFIKDDKIKIGDFGISQKGSNKNLGTLNFLSYESIKLNKTNKLSDLFQVGCILYELVTLSSPFSANNINDMIRLFEDKNYKNYIIKNISSFYSIQLVNIISKLLSLNASDRLEVISNYNISRNEDAKINCSNKLAYV
ncbi:NIMA related kinase 3, putative [Plasmodium chabaudi adami]|uniref:NIMA related kinase 3, putative n=1 Tax=Plasmodium chabaudi adami TaxID=5826 RepID=A0A1D3RRF4_PLACE|nr:NIMA related kinase 3, putative [Plasmodium chabaudi adami]